MEVKKESPRVCMQKKWSKQIPRFLFYFIPQTHKNVGEAKEGKKVCMS
jgi:hypothetical protein